MQTKNDLKYNFLNNKEVRDSIGSIKNKLDARLLILRQDTNENYLKFQLEYPTSKYVISTDYNLSYINGVAIIEPLTLSEPRKDKSDLDDLLSLGLVSFDSDGSLTHYPGYVFYKCLSNDSMKVYEIHELDQYYDDALINSNGYFDETSLAPSCK